MLDKCTFKQELVRQHDCVDISLLCYFGIRFKVNISTATYTINFTLWNVILIKAQRHQIDIS